MEYNVKDRYDLEIRNNIITKNNPFDIVQNDNKYTFHHPTFYAQNTSSLHNPYPCPQMADLNTNGYNQALNDLNQYFSKLTHIDLLTFLL